MTNISINKLHEFKDHPYKVLDNDEMNSLIESVQEQGIMSPLIVRPLEGTTNEYEIISGHRRFRAAQKAGLSEVPAFIRPVSRDEAAIMLVDSNLHREHILPSEKAYAYKMKYDALKRQGKRTDLTSSQVETKLRTDKIIAIEAGESRNQIQRYIRLTNLIPELLELMDEGKMAFSVGVELSYLSVNMQFYVLDVIEREDCTPSYSQAFHMHKAMREGTISFQYIDSLMSAEKPNQREVLKISAERVRDFVPKNYNEKQTEEFIVKAVEHYQRYLKRQRDRER
ncbi:MAG: ParB/RepB/Spo0J family partition protein [Eubacteriales bacterium]|nr:ParB/RepB/Spo0J family partition protein [Eubacteriales bacterium]